ncbi:DNA polymerase III subunit chi, partial [uncultured Bosea sp.]
MAEILFFHLQSRPLEQVLPTILERALAREQKVVVEVSSQERLSAVDDHLWTYADESFLPHVTALEADAPQNPVVLTTQAHNPNAAHVRVCADGVRIPDALQDYERVVLIFD